MAKKIQKDVTEKNKIYIAVFLTLLILASILFVSFTFFNPNKGSVENTEEFNVSRDEIIKRLSVSAASGVKPADVVIQKVKLTDLPVYPVEWQKKFFKSTEIANQLVSGEAADPDKDGLTNKEEYFQGTIPTNPDTLCDGKTDNDKCFGKNDGENVEQGISPLTGLSLDTQPEFLIKRQDFHILDNIQDTFEIAAREGVDFPTLYVLARAIDLSDQVESIKVLEQDDSRDNIINYTKVRVEVLKDFVDRDELTSFAKIYQITNVPDLEVAKQQYVELRDQMINTTVPNKYKATHQSYIFIFDKIVELIDLRIQGFENKNLLTDEFKDINRDKAVEVVWGYKDLNEKLSILEASSEE